MPYMTDAFANAAHYVAREHNEITRLRDRRVMDAQSALAAGDVIAALAAQYDVARLEGQLQGLDTALGQVRILRERHMPEV